MQSSLSVGTPLYITFTFHTSLQSHFRTPCSVQTKLIWISNTVDNSSCYSTQDQQILAHSVHSYLYKDAFLHILDLDSVLRICILWRALPEQQSCQHTRFLHWRAPTSGWQSYTSPPLWSAFHISTPRQACKKWCHTSVLRHECYSLLRALPYQNHASLAVNRLLSFVVDLSSTFAPYIALILENVSHNDEGM